MAGKKQKKNTTKKQTAFFWKQDKYKRIVGLMIILFAFLLLVSGFSYLFSFQQDFVLVESIQEDMIGNEYVDYGERNALGIVGAKISDFFIRKLFGLPSLLIVVLSMMYGVNWVFLKNIFKTKKWTFHTLFLLLYLSSLLSFIQYVFFPESFFPLGGFVGHSIAGSTGWLTLHVKTVGTSSILFMIGLIYLVWTFDLSFDFLLSLFKKKPNTDHENSVEESTSATISMDESIFEKDNIELDVHVEEQTAIQPDLVIKQADKNTEAPAHQKEQNQDKQEDIQLNINEVTEEKIIDDPKNEGNYDPKADLSNYEYPRLDYLLDHGGDKVVINKEELEKNKSQIVETLRNYNIEISKIKATIGPTVTLYEIVPAPGVRISKIKNLEDDIALSLAALGIRIIAPIPGKGTIGIEVPNENKEIVSMKSILSSEKFRNSSYELPIGFGKNIANEIFLTDLTKMPHLLMAGATGQGKSVGINAILVSLLYKKHPSQLKFVLVDPKKVELSIYNSIENHFLAKLPGEEEAIITDVRKVVNTLNALCIEMDNRYELLKKAKARNIKEYNKKFVERQLNPLNGHQFLPYIVLVIDEFADLIMTAGKEIETPIARLAQLARAIGIHLILATQRPSVNIITGVIKANFPARISFKVTSKVDSRTILDAGGADQLIGRGDMLFSQGSDLTRLQCAFVDTPEVMRIISHIEKQQGYPTAFELPEYVDPNEDKDSGGNYSAEERDALFEDAARLVVSNQMGSTSLIQRRLKLGYNRAGRLMDQLEDAGIVGPNLGSKAREVLYHSEAELEQYLNTLKDLS